MDTTRPTLALIAGRLVGAAATFAIPALLVRALDPTEVGTYRELFLIFTSVYLLAQFGLFETLYYFVPRRDESAGAFVANTVLALAAVGLLCVAIGPWAAPSAAAWFGNPVLERHLPFLAAFLGLMLVAAGLEVVMTARRRYAAAAVTYAGSDLLRAAALALPPLVFGTVQSLLVGAVAFAALRVICLVRFLRQEFGASLRLSRARWAEQLAYAVPFGAAATIEVLQVNYHQYAVARWFDTQTFAIYSIACLQIPVVELLGASAINVMMVAMAERAGDARAVLALWHQTIARLALMFVPMVALLLLVAHDLITFLYTDAFAASAPIFMLSLAFIVMYALPVDGALRVFARTRFILGMNVFRLAFIAATIGGFVSAFGLMGAMLSTVAATALVKLAALVRIRQLLGVPATELLPWRALARTLAATAVAAAAAALVNAGWALPAPVSLLVVSLVFGVTCLAILTALHARPVLRALLPQEERAR
jgi:O-antigen/teichoic acid export membrane protein